MNLTTEEKQEIRNAILLALTVVVWTLAFCGWFCPPAKADCVLEFGATWCGPCQQFKPIVKQVRSEGYDVRPVDIDERKDLARAFHVTKVPTCVYVAETPAGNYELGRIEGLATAGQLRRLCVAPMATTVGAATRNAFRWMFGPTPVVEW